jgi:uncharacterized membrane protein YraQ (UPF0718 family)/copper chaperone CopZ
MEFVLKYLSALWLLIQEMAPWLLLGLLFAGILKVYFPQKNIDKYLGKSNFKSVLNAALLGIPMPLCSCGVIPTGISFFKNGASKGASNSFLISTPQTGVDSIFATYSMLGWPFAILRPIVAFVTGITGGVLTNILVKNRKNTAKENSFSKLKIATEQATCSEGDSCGCHSNEKQDSRASIIRMADYAFLNLLQDIAKWLIIGFLLAALISVLLPADFFSRFQNLGVLELLIILAASVPLYVCATGSIPIAAVLLMKGVSPGAALVFLMAGPATNMATITVLGKTMGTKSLLVYLGTIIGGAFIFGWLTNLFIPADFILSKITMLHNGHEHAFLPQWLQITSAIILLTEIIGGYFIKNYKSKKEMAEETGKVFTVEGMHCSHCEANVVKNVEKMNGVEKITADSNTNSIKITGKDYDIEEIKATINGLGYQFIGE